MLLPTRARIYKVNTSRLPDMQEPEPFMVPRRADTLLGAGDPTAPFSVPLAVEPPNTQLVCRRVGREAFLAMAQALVREAKTADEDEEVSVALGNRCMIGGKLKP